MSFLNKLFGYGLNNEQKQQLEEALSELYLPHLAKNLIEAKLIDKLKLKGKNLSLTLNWPYPGKEFFDQVEEEITNALFKVDGVETVTLEQQISIKAHQTQPNVQAINGIKNIIAVGSGKGGVGKSTTSTNLALALAEQGAKVGILDADIYGPSIPTLLGISQRPDTVDGKIMIPLQAHGICAMSIGFLIEPDSPMMWRGPLINQTLGQLLNETVWDHFGALDYLVIDLPPGTGDTQLTMAQQIPVSGAVIVTTPQDLALIDAKKAYKMFEKVSINTLGIVENMSSHICSNCGHEEHIFGKSGGIELAREYDIEALGTLPLNIKIREDADAGRPSVIADPSSPIAKKYREIAHKVSAKIANSERNYSGAFPKIEVR